MARRSSTTTDSARSSESDHGADKVNDPGTGSTEGPEGTEGPDGSGAASAQGGSAPPPAKRRKRGPNKPKPGIFTVETNAHMKHEEIIKLLTAHAVTKLGPDVAANMVLQVVVGGTCRPLEDAKADG